MKKSTLSQSPNLIHKENEQTNKPQLSNTIIRDSFGQDLAQRIKKAKDEIFVQSHQRKGKAQEKKNSQNNFSQQQENSYKTKNAESSKKKGGKNSNVNGVPPQIESEQELMQDELNPEQKESIQYQKNNMHQENEEHSDFNSNQIECSGSDRNQDEDDDHFMRGFMPQKNQEFGQQFTILGGAIDTQKFINLIFNKNEGNQDTDEQQQQKKQNGKRRKSKKENASEIKSNENLNSSQKISKFNADGNTQTAEVKPKREYKKRSKKVDTSDQDAMKNQNVKSQGDDLKMGDNQLNTQSLQTSIVQNAPSSNSNGTTPKNHISKNIIIQNYKSSNLQFTQHEGNQSVTNENQNNSNNMNQHTVSNCATAGGSSSTKKGFRQYTKETKSISNYNEGNSLIDQEGLINLFLQVQQGFQSDENQNQQSNEINQNLGLLQSSTNHENPITSTPNNTKSTKRKQKDTSKSKNNQNEGALNDQNEPKQKQKDLTTPAKGNNFLYQEPQSINGRINMEIENLGSEIFVNYQNENQALQGTATTATSSSSKKQKIHNNNDLKEKSEEKPRKKLKVSQEDLGDSSLQQTPQQIISSSAKKTRKEKKQKEQQTPESQTFKNSQILQVTKTDKSLLVQLAQTSVDTEQNEIEKQIEEFSFTKEVKKKLNPEDKKAEEEQLKNSKVFNILWEKQQIYKRKLELYQLSSFERYQQHKILGQKNINKSEQFYIHGQQVKDQDDSEIKYQIKIQTDSSENHQQNSIQIEKSDDNQQKQLNSEKKQTENSNSDQNLEVENTNSSQQQIKSNTLIEEKQSEPLTKIESENSESKKPQQKNEKDDQDNRDYTQKFSDLKNKFVMLKQYFKPSIITA
ncbi:hypothetical protein TTHERM_00317260 (macronuclear) [Tetrahymena thermophila SB210]|uniref:Uncharacterized protein n=1 Tax=Tetrahymena thermophila (strain SB210) TaxID=312017 RepID=I7MG71_TETTS|nr:hypothetical protein TTHERM_00317260 [Tetrahymena thermophila SB210]EAS01162.2 hypothetical protein TTHERM_00317260 [Tetrahymena thermophila SB210]|eukprot:XP_001021407.2 hypothetical protein TTHERM_00317260 [Tetrahymena thermophila SB210]